MRKEKVQFRLKEKVDELSQVKQELADYKQFQDLKIKQENEIKKLEADLEEMKFRHAKRTRDLKSKFLKDKEKYRYILGEIYHDVSMLDPYTYISRYIKVYVESA